MDRIFAWAGGVVFVATLAFCGATYFMTWSVAARPDISWTAMTVDTALFSTFALHHSLFSREAIKHALTGIFPERLLRSVYVWAASSLLLLVCLLWQPVGGDIFRVTGPRSLAHAIVQLLGVWLIAKSVAGIDALELAGIRQLEPVRRKTEPALQMGGVYRVVRHPLYLGWTLLVFGAAHMTGDRLVFAVVSVLYLVVAIPWEERSLRATLGDQYARYQAMVRWRMIPFIY